MATTSERDYFSEKVLAQIGKNRARLHCKPITGFLAMKGDRYNHELMILGRAVNGWTEGILPHDLVALSAREDYAVRVFKSVIGNDKCPMSWVTDCWESSNGYNTKRSAFWRVIRAVVRELRIGNTRESSWPSHLVWSNLYKVAPAEGGNPNSVLCNIQFSSCRSLLEMEVSTYSPKRMLFLTGLGWAKPFLRDICPGLKEISKTHVEATGEIRHDSQITKIVVASHPQGKQESMWVQEVMEALRA